MNSIEVKNLTKIYKVYDDPIDRLKEVINPFKKIYHKEFKALDDINFSIQSGQTVGIIGKNGSGKSTLLKIITGVLATYHGKIDVKGEISALLELGGGFNPNLSGLENIYLSHTIRGKSKKDVESVLDDIIAFADIGEHIYQPVKTYSSGMFARLAFSVSIHSDPNILIIDEALSVGDMAFQNKCYAKIEKFVSSKDKTVLFVSHSLSAIRLLCNEVIWIHEGRLMDMGDTNIITDKYEKFMSKQKEKKLLKNVQNKKDTQKDLLSYKGDKIDNAPCFYKNIRFFNIDEETYKYTTGDNISISLDIFNTLDDNEKISIGIAVFRSDGLEIARINNIRDDKDIIVVPGDNRVKFDIQSLNLLSGTYLFSFFLANKNLAQTYHKIENAYKIDIETPYSKCGWKRSDGIIYFSHNWEIN